jgi:hypothetical protein
MTMSELANSAPLGLEKAGKSPVVAPAIEAASMPQEIADYVTPPPKKRIVVAVRYCQATKGEPMPYDLATATAGAWSVREQ